MNEVKLPDRGSLPASCGGFGRDPSGISTALILIAGRLSSEPTTSPATIGMMKTCAFQRVLGNPPTFVLFAALAISVSVSCASGQTGAGRVFFDASACKNAHQYSDQQCDTAFRNAKAEFAEKAPRFSARSECEHYFRRCMIGGIFSGGRHVDFVPGMRGFEIDNGPRRQVTPVAEGGSIGGLFSPRPIDRQDEAVSPARVEQAKVAWRQMTAPRVETAAPSGTVPAAESEKDEPKSPGGLQSYPIPKAMLEDLRSREQRYLKPSSN